jgi:uncharacterized protein YlxW (UPF0749 family)
MFGLGLNPLVIGGAILAFALYSAGLFFYGDHVGSTTQKLVCEQRVTAIKAQLDAANEAIRETTEQWRAAIGRILEDEGTKAQDAQKRANELQQKVEQYEQSLGDQAQCLTDQSDADRLR